jgi:hypothetical protein
MANGPDTASDSEPRQPGCSCVNLLILLAAAGTIAGFAKAGVDSGGGWMVVLGLAIGLPLAFVVVPVVVVGGIVIAVKACGVLYDLLTASFEGDTRGWASEILGDDDPDAPRRVWRRRTSIAILSALTLVWVASWMTVWLRWRPDPDAWLALIVGLGGPASFVLMWAIDRHERRQRRDKPLTGDEGPRADP